MNIDTILKNYITVLVTLYPRSFFSLFRGKNKDGSLKYLFLLNWINKKTPLLLTINFKYNWSTKIYWILHNMQDFKVCEYSNCNNKIGINKNIKLNKGYHRCCCNKHAQLLPDIKIKIEETHLKNLGVRYPMQSKDVKNKSEATCYKKYGVKNYSLTKESIEHRKYINDNKSVLEKKNIIKKRENTCIKKYNVKSTLQLKTIRNANLVWAKYKYNSEIFDSSWELAFYIWHIDNNVKIIREPCTFTYVDQNNKEHTYTPDFLVNGIIYEIKGDNHFDVNGNPIYKGKSWKSKYECAIKNNVHILRYSDIKKYLDYAYNKYNSSKWFKEFKICK